MTIEEGYYICVTYTVNTNKRHIVLVDKKELFDSETIDTNFVRAKALSDCDDFISLVHFVEGEPASISGLALGLLDQNLDNVPVEQEAGKSKRSIRLKMDTICIVGKEHVACLLRNDNRKIFFPSDAQYRSQKNGTAALWNLVAQYFSNDGKKKSMHERIVRSAICYGQAARSENLRAAFVWMAVGYESLLICEGQEITDALVKKAEYLHAKDICQQERVGSFIRKMYKARSDLVHGRSFGVLQATYRLGMRYLHEWITKFLTDPNLCKIEDEKDFERQLETKGIKIKPQERDKKRGLPDRVGKNSIL